MICGVNAVRAALETDPASIHRIVVERGRKDARIGDVLRLATQAGIPVSREPRAALDRLRLVDWVAPVQFAIRLLILPGSRLLELPEVRRLAGPADPEGLVHPWAHPDPRVDELQKRVERTVAAAGWDRKGRREIFAAVRAMAREAAGETVAGRPAVPDREAAAAVPYLTEPWYC